jgi:Macoilin family
MEAKIRWKDNRNIPHLDLCRPFAAHCIGYPVVTLGFGFKSYIGYRIRQRKQKEVAKENEFYMQLLQQALPQEIEKSEEQSEVSTTDTSATNLSTSNNNITVCKNTQNHQSSKVSANGSIEPGMGHMNGGVNTTTNANANTNASTGSAKQQNVKKNAEKENGCIQNLENNHHHHNHQNHHSHHHHHPEIIPNNTILSKPSSKANHLNYNNLQSVKNTNTTSYQQIQNGIANPIKELNVPAKCSPYKNKDDHNTYTHASTNKKEYEKEKIIKDSNYSDETAEQPSQKRKEKQQKDNIQYNQSNASSNLNEKNKVCEQCQRLEQDIKRLKSEYQTMKSLEQEIRQKFENVKTGLQTRQKDHEELQKQ